MNVRKVDGNCSQIGRGQAPAPCGREVVRDRAVDDACFRGGDLDTLAQGGALVGGQREGLQALDEAQVADSGEIEADVSQGVCDKALGRGSARLGAGLAHLLCD